LKYSHRSLRAIRLFRDLDKALTSIHPSDGSQATTIESNFNLQQEALDLLDKINWDQPGYPELGSIDNKALEPLALVLGSLKQDVDFYLQERQKELEQQEQTYCNFLRLSSEIEQALTESEQDRLNSEELSKKNLALANEISQSQKAVFMVLADFIDRRSNMSEGYTRGLARMVGKLATMLDFTPEEAELLQDATQLFHVGYIGVPEGEKDLTAHCLLGAQVLENIKVYMMKYASQIARYHHEKWNGSGSPHGLIGEDIPKEARLVALAEVIQLHSKEHLDSYLCKEAGNSLDPKMVDIILSNLNMILEWKSGEGVTA
jgi:response regulator RpfG family c-di-GMP phosphodiesterase